MNFQFLIALLIAVTSFTSCWSSASTSTESSNTVNYSSSPSGTPAITKTNSSNANLSESNTKMTESKTGFTSNLPDGFQKPTDEAARTLFKEYGSVFVARGGAIAPKKVVFKDAADVSAFQSTLSTATESIGRFQLELQAPAMKALKDAIAEAKAQNLSITPRDKDAAKRSYDETIELWASRVDPALKHWVGRGKLTQADADRIKALSPYEQLPEIFKLEAKSIWFSKDMQKSIIYSVAPPGTSQHLSMLAFDVVEHNKNAVRAILAKHGWFQTVTSDEPHFTYLGVPESELTGLGLKLIAAGDGRRFWVPDI